MFPTGNRIDLLDVPGVGKIEATLINAGNPTIFVNAASLGLKGTELQGDINGDKDLLKRVEAVRALGAVAMSLVATPQEATEKRPHTPKLAFVAKPAVYTASDGKRIDANTIDLLARIFSMGVLHHANYFTYFEMGRTELLRFHGKSYRDLEAEGTLMVIVKIGCKALPFFFL